jgi:hypothetical protein
MASTSWMGRHCRSRISLRLVLDWVAPQSRLACKSAQSLEAPIAGVLVGLFGWSERAELMRYRYYVLLFMLVIVSWAPSARAQSTGTQTAPQQPPHSADDLSARATDPTASLMSFGFVNDFHTSFYNLDDKGFEFRFQPVVPFRAWGASNILRVVVPYQGSGPGNAGLKDVSMFDLIIVPQGWGRLAVDRS